MDHIIRKFQILCGTPLDINEHLPTLYTYATQCESVIELGVRGCISSWALLLGLLDNGKSKKYLLMNDISECNIQEILTAAKDIDFMNIVIEYQWKNDLDLEVKENVDMVFIDTWHVYGQLKRELNKFSKITNKYIIMHDTEVDKIFGETIRLSWNPEEQSRESGIPVNEITRGLQPAIDEFLSNNPEWKLLEHYTNNNGLTILHRCTI